jgi:hypothetical protein
MTLVHLPPKHGDIRVWTGDFPERVNGAAMPTRSLPLDRVNPDDAWKPWEPTASDPWDLKKAGHLYRRAGFGGSLDELRDAVKKGQVACIDKFLSGDPAINQGWEKLLADLGEKTAIQGNPSQLRSWWLYGILNTPHPLQEKMTLFWHNHFATSIAKVQRPMLMCRQNVLLRRHALGKFRPFLLDVSRDAAMLYWLDSNSNVKGRPNENYARELMELFSLGVGNYSETDVREAARAFTGWAVNSDVFEFDDSLHDFGPKTVLKQDGKWNGEDIVRIVLEQPVAARFIARKLYRCFISETAVPPDALLEPLAETFRKSDYDIGVLMRAMLSSRHFFSAHAYRQRLKDPVEFAFGAVRALWDMRSDGDKLAVTPDMLVSALEEMGQELFAPPNVKGWPGGQSWLNTATVLARHNFTLRVSAGDNFEGNFPAVTATPSFDNETMQQQGTALLAAAASGGLPAASVVGAIVPQPPKILDSPQPDSLRDVAGLVNRENASTPEQIITVLSDALLQGDMETEVRDRLVAFLADGQPTGPALQRRIRESAHAIMTMPEYQLA